MAHPDGAREHSTGSTTLTAEVLARRVVQSLAPHELATFGLIAAPYLDDPARAERRMRGGGDDMLGFGLGEIAEVVTPVAALVAGSVVAALSDGLVDATRTGVGRLFRKVAKRPPVELSADRKWTPDELARVRAVAVGRCAGLGWEKRESEALADAIVVALLLEQE